MSQKKNNAVCAICGKGYYVCNSCKDQKKLNPWKIHTDTSEHYKIFQVVRGYFIGLYTKEEAKDKFKNIDLTGLEGFIPDVKSTIKTILSNGSETKDENTVRGAENNIDVPEDETVKKSEVYKKTMKNKRVIK